MLWILLSIIIVSPSAFSQPLSKLLASPYDPVARSQSSKELDTSGKPLAILQVSSALDLLLVAALSASVSRLYVLARTLLGKC